MTTVATLFAGPGTLQCGPRYRNQSIIFHYVIDGTIQTLSSTKSPAQGSYKGQLFVPSLLLEDNNACNNITAPFIPSNATRRDDIPPLDHPDIIGLAPWVTPECSQAYLAASRREDARALIFYQPQSTDSQKPPPADNALWDLGDGGQWKKDNQFPIYAVPGPAGANLMHLLSQYSGQRAGDYSDHDNRSRNCTRLYALLDLEPEHPSSTVPGVWVFVLAILGAIVLMMAFACLIMQQIKRRRRERRREGLQRRLVAGEVDLESLGIKRLVVPPQLLCQLPVYVYPGSSPSPPSSPSSSDDGEEEEEKEKEKEESISAILEEIMPNLQPPPRAAHQTHQHRLTFSQRTCAICLDDFVPATSLVRELPCTHIFHPECVDAFLMRDGSTCPVCKHNVLPPSFIEFQVSNLMARHHHSRQQRGHNTPHSSSNHFHHRSPMHETQLPDLPLPLPSAAGYVFGRLRAWMHMGDSNGNSHDERRSEQEGGRAGEEDVFHPPPQPGTMSNEGYDPVRREMMQRRAMVLLGTPVGDRPEQ